MVCLRTEGKINGSNWLGTVSPNKFQPAASKVDYDCDQTLGHIRVEFLRVGLWDLTTGVWKLTVRLNNLTVSNFLINERE